MKLIDSTGKEVKVGSIIQFEGQDVQVIYCPPPHKPSSSGKMQIKYASGENSIVYYCGVFDCKWTDRDDQW
jgi:hypothetical protein